MTSYIGSAVSTDGQPELVPTRSDAATALPLHLLLVLLVAVARMVWRGRDLVGAPATWAGVVAGLSALAVHSGLDFLWHLPAIPLTAAVLAGLAAPPLQERGPSAHQRRARQKEDR
jgi:hypothetical protein